MGTFSALAACAGIVAGTSVTTGCVHHQARESARVSTTTITSAPVTPAVRHLDVHVAPDLVARCGRSAARDIAVCVARGPLRHERLQIVGRIGGGVDADERTEAALARAERMKRYFVDQGVPASRVTTSASVSEEQTRRDTDEVDVSLAP